MFFKLNELGIQGLIVDYVTHLLTLTFSRLGLKIGSLAGALKIVSFMSQGNFTVFIKTIETTKVFWLIKAINFSKGIQKGDSRSGGVVREIISNHGVRHG